MAVEANIIEQLQELRKWQREQQEELMRKQQEQREKLSDEQNRIYEALSLSVGEITLSDQSLDNTTEQRSENNSNLIDLDIPDEDSQFKTPQKIQDLACYNTPNKVKSNLDSMSLRAPEVQLSLRRSKSEWNSRRNSDSHGLANYRDVSTDSDQQSFSSNTSLKHVPIDDLPVPSPNKDFHTLLEESLKDPNVADVPTKPRPVVKKPFLKKGQGLARFMPTPKNDKIPKCTLRPRSASLSTTPPVSHSKSSSKSNNLEKFNSLPKSKKNVTSRKSLPIIPSVAQPKLTLKNVPPPQKKSVKRSPIRTTPISEKNSSEVMSDPNSSDLEFKNKRELEEVRIFELLEDKAQNSSFCSTSSTVIAFMQQSTPLKHKALLHSAAKNKLSLDDIGDETLEEIVRSTQSNNLLSVETQKNVSNRSISHWDDVPLPKATNGKTIKGAVLPYGTDLDEFLQDYDSNAESYQDQNNMSLHVRFAEYNEYKTMTDTSSISSDSQTVINYLNNKKAWSDGSATPDSSDVESISSQVKSDSDYGSHKVERSDFSTENQNNSDEDETEIFNEEDDETEEENRTGDMTLRKSDNLGENNNSKDLLKSELLKTRLLELEKEIEIFRKESAALTLQRQKLIEERAKLQEERINIQRSLKEKEESIESEKRKAENILHEEKKRLAREKAALENRMKDAWEKAQKNKQERLEIQSLKDQIDELREEMCQKESKWSAAQARQRSQIRVLQTENSKLKQEIEKLQQQKNARLKKPISSSTKAIHQINKFLAERKRVSPFRSDNVFEEELKRSGSTKQNRDTNFGTQKSTTVDPDPIDHYDDDLESVEELPIEQRPDRVETSKTTESISRTRHLYESLLKDVKNGFSETQVDSRNFANDRENVHDQVAQDFKRNAHNEETAEDETEPSSKSPNQKFSETEKKNTAEKTSRSEKQTPNKQGIREVHHPDGRIEYWYPNGNVKKVFPDKGVTKMIYYNGDVREVDKHGTVRYFYAATRIWHTTAPDGHEILEFPDGQVERRSKDGTIEVSFPDGSIKVIQADGSEKWTLRDGTVAETSADGEKILTLPNGQREIHTKDHKRREYPDGTVKLVYPDGMQETRYANGRIRLKDKDGNLIVDTHQVPNDVQ
ncbi:hypothetical protein QAD02_011570 [Eretmocerus hayati]|uniref:Uncharacterized protein n=1 Tax=Eretmocerus hayati TaxID=131215 RepID=A0ACC2NZS4_9HYME|nr:hypothetical protein QAD02_011570 [Eretmocerus hayati]